MMREAQGHSASTGDIVERTAEVEHLTEGLRSSDDAVMRRLRQLLPERGIDPESAVLAILFPDDVRLHYGVVVDRDGRVFEFDLDYSGGAIGDAAFRNWTDVSSTFRETTFDDYVEAALEIVTAGGRIGPG